VVGGTSKQLGRVYWLLLSVITANNTLVRLLAVCLPMREFSRFGLRMCDLQTRGHPVDRQTDG
jgi:hypothetical protein